MFRNSRVRNAWISPAARILLDSHSIKLEQVVGTGPRGLILKEDALKAIQGVPQRKAADRAETKATGKAVSSSMAPKMPAAPASTGRFEAAKKVPLQYVSAESNVEELLSMLGNLSTGEPLGLTEAVVRCVGRVMAEMPEINQVFNGDQVVRLPHEHVSVRPAGGLDPRTVVIHNATRIGFLGIQHHVRELRLNTSAANELGVISSIEVEDTDGTEIETAVGGVRAPSAASVSVGQPRALIQLQNGVPVVTRQSTVSIAYDLRAMTDSTAARFASRVAQLLSHPDQLL